MLSILAASAAPTYDPSSWLYDNVFLLPGIMAASFVVIILFGKRLPYKGAEVGIAAVVSCFVLATLTAGSWVIDYEDAQAAHHSDDHGDEDHSDDDHSDDEDHSDDDHSDDEDHSEDEDHEEGFGASDELASGPGLELAVEEGEDGGEEHYKPTPVVNDLEWFSIGDREPITIGTLVDGQSVMLLFVVTFISMLVHVFSTDYVGGDRRYTHYFAFLSLFTAAMLFMVLASSTLQLIVGWELVGVCSFALIGHWWEEERNSDAALKAFLTNRVGDMGLLIGMTILYFAAGTFDILTINHAAVVGDISHSTLLVASLCLLAAVMSKSGQFVLHTWLPDAMAGPTPVSALIHAATMVVAGIYMVGRLYPVFWDGLAIPGSSFNMLALIGAVTVVGGGLLAFVQDDVKKVLAYSTVSQLGYMALALGVGAWTAAMFHLFTHAFFKAGLFLGAGSLSHACHHSFDMKKEMGGLRKIMPVTFWTFMVCTAALIGIFPTAGFWSKDEILVGTGGFPGTDANGTYTVFLIMGLLGALLTAGYMTRVIWLVFFGEYRGHSHPHENGPRITVPLRILAVMAIFAGFLNLPFSDLGGWSFLFEQWVEPGGGDTFPVIGHGKPSLGLALVASLLGFAGIAAVWTYYQRLFAKDKYATEYHDNWMSRSPILRAGHTLLVEKYYLDRLYSGIVADSTRGWIARAANWFNQNILDGVVNGVGRAGVVIGNFIYRFVDQGAIDGAVNGAGITADASGEVLRNVQSGRIRQYASLMFGAAAVFAAVFIVVV